MYSKARTQYSSLILYTWCCGINSSVLTAWCDNKVEEADVVASLHALKVALLPREDTIRDS
jgi:hypothetical protein